MEALLHFTLDAGMEDVEDIMVILRGAGGGVDCSKCTLCKGTCDAWRLACEQSKRGGLGRGVGGREGGDGGSLAGVLHVNGWVVPGCCGMA